MTEDSDPEKPDDAEEEPGIGPNPEEQSTETTDDSGETYDGEEESSSWSRRRKVGVAVLAVLLVIGGTLVVLAQPTPSEEPLNVSEQNSRVYAKLVDANITSAVVDINDSRSLVRYEVPPEMSVEESEQYAMGATASIAEEAHTIRLQVYEDFEKVEEVRIATEDVLAYRDNEISLDELERRIERSPS